MELAIPLVALGSLYVINNQKKPKTCKKQEGFANRELLPNTDIPDANFSTPEYEETTYTSKLSTVNKYDGGAYTDKYFNPESGTQYAPSDSTDASYYSLTGKKVDREYFQHNNMVPFFGSTVRTTYTSSNTNESLLDSMTGSGSQQFSKGEQAPLFAPSENYQWAYGAPNQSDFMQSRVNPSTRMANVKPFAEERVAPGLGLGYTTEGAGGFNSGMMERDSWREKTVDQLRVDNKQKASELMMLGHEGPAMSRITNLGSIGQFEKNRPDRHFESGPERLFTTTGASKGPMMNAIPVDRHVNRPDTTVSYVGGAGYNVESSYVPGEYKPSTNIDLGARPIGIANANGRNYAHDSEYGIKSSKAYVNNRSANKSGEYFGALGGVIGAAVAPVMDVLRPSRKENTIGTLRPYQNAKSTAGGQSYLFNPNDRPAPTIRETTENSKFHLNVNANQRGGAYEVSDHQVAYTNRQNTDDFYYAGGASAGERGREARPYDAEYRQRNNDIKSSTIDGRLVPGNMSLMNGDINMRQANRDAMFKNNRPVAPSMPYQAPSVATMGELQGNSGLYSTIQMDRTSPEILSGLQGNPYALSVTSGL
jgi:hypothetical protein